MSGLIVRCTLAPSFVCSHTATRVCLTLGKPQHPHSHIPFPDNFPDTHRHTCEHLQASREPRAKYLSAALADKYGVGALAVTGAPPRPPQILGLAMVPAGSSGAHLPPELQADAQRCEAGTRARLTRAPCRHHARGLGCRALAQHAGWGCRACAGQRTIALVWNDLCRKGT